MASLCTKPPQQRLQALIAQDIDWTYDDAESILEQGMPTCTKEQWDDPEVVYDFCQQLTSRSQLSTGPPSEDGSDT